MANELISQIIYADGEPYMEYRWLGRIECEQWVKLQNHEGMWCDPEGYLWLQLHHPLEREQILVGKRLRD